MAYARTQEEALRRIKIKRELRRLGNRNFRNDAPLKDLKKELKNLKSFKKRCQRSLSGEHSYEPYKTKKIKCVLCGQIKSLLK